jgi:hypothetical protein
MNSIRAAHEGEVVPVRGPVAYDVAPGPSGRAVYVQAAWCGRARGAVGGVNRAASRALIALGRGGRLARVQDLFGE